jgi:hypothetical protein
MHGVCGEKGTELRLQGADTLASTDLGKPTGHTSNSVRWQKLPTHNLVQFSYYTSKLYYMCVASLLKPYLGQLVWSHNFPSISYKPGSKPQISNLTAFLTQLSHQLDRLIRGLLYFLVLHFHFMSSQGAF